MTSTQTHLQAHLRLVATYDALSNAEKAAHIEQHTETLDWSVELFEILNGYSMHVIEEGICGVSVAYTARYRWAKTKFAVDRRYPVEAQMTIIALGLKATVDEFEGWQMKKELDQLVEMHGVTESKTA